MMFVNQCFIYLSNCKITRVFSFLVIWILLFATPTLASINGSNFYDQFVDLQNIKITRKGDADPEKSKVQIEKDELIANGSDFTEVTISLYDSEGDPLSSGGDLVEIIIEGDGKVSPLIATDNKNGTYSAKLTAPKKSGKTFVYAKLNNQVIHDGKWVSFLPGPADPLKSIIKARNEEIVADGLSYTVITVSLHDKDGNKLTEGGDKIELSTDAGKITNIVDALDGTYNARLTSSTKSEKAQISGTLDEVSIENMAVVSFVSGDPDPERTIIITEKNEIIANGKSSAIITVKLFDKYGNKIGKDDSKVELSYSPIELGTLGDVVNSGDGTYTALLTSKTSIGIVKIKGTVEDLTILDSTIVEVIAGPAFYLKSTVEAFMPSITADEISTTKINVTLFDEHENPLKKGGDNVKLYTTLGTLDDEKAQDNFDGTYTGVIKSSMDIGEALITGTVNGNEIEDFAPVKFVADENIVDRCKTTIKTEDTELLADGVSKTNVILKIYNTKGNEINEGGLNVEFFTKLGNIGDVTDNMNGTYGAVLSSKQVAGVDLITASINGEKICEAQKVDFIIGEIDPSKCTIVASKNKISTDDKGQSIILVQLKDKYGNSYKTGGGQVEFKSILGSIEKEAIDNKDGSYEGKLTALKDKGIAEVSAKVNGKEINETVSVEIVGREEADPTKSIVEAQKMEISANGMSTVVVTVILKDKEGKQLKNGGDEVILSTSAGNITFDPIDNADGTYNGRLISSVNIEVATVKASVNGVVIDDEEKVNFVEPTIDVSKSYIKANQKEIVANGNAYTIIEVGVVDKDGVLISLGVDKVELFTSGGLITAKATGNQRGIYLGTLTSVKKVQTAVISGKINGKKISVDTQVDFVAGEPSIKNTLITSNKKQIVANKKSKAIITVQLFDSFGNVINEGGFDVELDATKGTLDDVKDNNNGTYTTILTSSKKVETSIISGTINTVSISDNEEVEFVDEIAIDPSLCLLEAKDTILLADEVSSTLVKVTIIDVNGDQLDHGSDKVKLKNTEGSLSSLKDNGDGTYVAFLTSSDEPKISYLSATVNEKEIKDKEIVHFVKEFLADPEFTKIIAERPIILADGKSQSKISVILYDARGERVKNGDYKVQITNNQIGKLSELKNNDDGTFTSFLTSSEKEETCLISGTLNDDAILSSAEVDFVKDIVADPSRTTIIATDKKLLANGESETKITVQVFDIAGDEMLVGGDVIELYTTAGTLKLPIPEDNQNGTYTTKLISSEKVEIALVGGKINGDTIYDNEKVLFVDKLVEIDLEQSKILTKHKQLKADGKSFTIVTALLYDADGKPVGVGGDEVVLKTSLGSLILGKAFDNEDGSYIDTLVSEKFEGDAILTGEVNGLLIKDYAKVRFGYDVETVDPSQCKISAKPSKIIANGISKSKITIILYDEDGEKLTQGGDVVIMDPPTGGSFNNKDGLATDNKDGTYTLYLTSSTEEEIVVVKGKVNGDKIGDSAEIEFYNDDVTVDPKTSIIDVDRNQTLVGGKVIISVKLIDTNGDEISIDVNEVELEVTPSELGSLGEIKFENGSYWSVFKAKDISGEVIITGTVNGETISDNAKILIINENEGEVDVPQGFSPNGDQINDLLVISGIIAYPQSVLLVFNRWGSKVYESQGYNNDWDGNTSSGFLGKGPLPNGTYFYVLDLGNGNEIKKGNFYISR